MSSFSSIIMIVNTYIFLLLFKAVMMIPESSFLDHEMHHFTLYAYTNEWNQTFFRNDSIFQLIDSSPVHFWLRCLDNEVRGYFTIESLMHHRYSREPAELVYFRNKEVVFLKERLHLYADDIKINYRASFGGADFIVNVAHKKIDSYLYISFSGWKHYNYFPMSKCKKSLFFDNKTKKKEPDYIMNVVTPDYVKGKTSYRRALNGFAKHIIYHKCALNLTRYEIIIQEEHFQDFKQHSELSKFMKSGLLILLFKGRSASRLQDGGYWFQAVYQNLAILRHWKENVRLALWDQDEYLNYNNNITRKQLIQYINKYDRKMSFCYDCPKDKPEIRSLSFTKHQYKLGSDLRHPKLIVNPNTAGCFRVHWDWCGPGTHSLSSEFAFLLHFENLLIPRWRFSKNELYKMSLVDITRPPLLACDPTTLINSNTSSINHKKNIPTDKNKFN